MLHFENKIEANLYEITTIYLKEVQQILNEFDEIILKGVHNIENYMIIEYAIRLISDILVVRKMKYHTFKKHK